MNAERPETDDSVNPTNAAPDVDDMGTDWTNTGDPPGDGNTETGWTAGNRWSAGAGTTGAAWLTQLQAIVDNLATQSAHVISEVGA
jgi:hypothetical protein